MGEPAEKMLLFQDGCWKEVFKSPEEKHRTYFKDFKYFYANIIDYARVVMCLIASFTVVNDMPLVSAVLLMSQTLLDWLDGPVARAYGQCTIFGSGIDWLADVQAQIVIMCWCILLDKRTFPLLMFITTVELGMCIFDYATTATGRYPILESPSKFPVYWILDWTMPRGSYNNFGIFLWLAYPMCILSYCLDMSLHDKSIYLEVLLKFLEISLFIPMLMYVWCEYAQLVHIIAKWSEAPRNKFEK
eukprot:gene12261-5845_t